jgi:hypothetical protein
VKSPLFRGGADRRLAEHRCGGVGDGGAFEEIGVLRSEEAHRVGEGEVAKVVPGDQLVLDQFPGLRQDHPHVRDVEMADIRAEDRVDPGAERVELAERDGVHPVVRLAAEEERLRVELEPVLLAGDLARGVIVVHRDPAVELVVPRVRPAVAAAQFGADVLIPVFLDQLRQQRAVELFRVHVFEPFLAAPLPVLDQVGEQLAGPAGTAFEETKAQIGEAPRDAAEENGLGHRVPGGSEVADMVEREIARGVAQAAARTDVADLSKSSGWPLSSTPTYGSQPHVLNGSFETKFSETRAQTPS